MIIGIEGPAGSGKSTMAKAVAPEVGATVVEGGIWYRALAFNAQNKGISSQDTEKLIEEAQQLDINVLPGEEGEARILLDGQDVTNELYVEEVSGAVGTVAQNLNIREVIVPQIRQFVHAHEPVFMVGRHIKQLFPEAAILRLTIDDNEADRRHHLRVGEAALSVSERNATDQLTAQLLGTATSEGIVTADVTGLSVDEQAEILRQFIASQKIED